jgi:hypothetical protein
MFKSLRIYGVPCSNLFGVKVDLHDNGHGDGMTPPLLAAVAITPLWHVDATEGACVGCANFNPHMAEANALM